MTTRWGVAVVPASCKYADMDTHHAQVPAPPTPNTASGRTPSGRWYFVLTILTAGLFAWVPFLHAAQRLNRPHLRRLAAVYGGVAVLMFALTGMTPVDAAGDPVGKVGAVLQFLTVVMSLATLGVACFQLAPLRREAYGLATPAPQPVAAADPAVAAVLAARARRAEARAIVTKDPLMARELGIGRPDRRRAYDDGGLVDLNGAPADAIATTCGIPAHTADLLVQAREARGGAFSDVDEALIVAEVPVQLWDQIRDRAIVVP